MPLHIFEVLETARSSSRGQPRFFVAGFSSTASPCPQRFATSFSDIPDRKPAQYALMYQGLYRGTDWLSEQPERIASWLDEFRPARINIKRHPPAP